MTTQVTLRAKEVDATEDQLVLKGNEMSHRREGFPFPSISVISSSTSVRSIAPSPVYFRLACLALLAAANDRSSHF